MSQSHIKTAKFGWNEIFKNPLDYTYYDLNAPHQFMSSIGEYFQKNHVKKILDLGCGLGNNLFVLQQMGFDMYGIDLSEVAVRSVLKRAILRNSKIEIQTGNFNKLPYADHFFDAVISIQTLNHGYEEDVQKGISEIERVIKPGGFIYITLPGRISKGKERYCLVKTAKKISEHVYIPQIGDEKGVPHIIYNRALLKKHYHHFKTIGLKKDDKDYYCLLGRYRNSTTR